MVGRGIRLGGGRPEMGVRGEVGCECDKNTLYEILKENFY